MQYIPVQSCLLVSKTGISTIVWQYKNRLIVSNINFVSGYRKQVRKICAIIQTVCLRYNANSIITVCKGPIGCAVTNFAVIESIFVLIHKGNTAKLFICISK